MENLTISALAQAASVNIETVRFYQRKGLVGEPNKPLGGIRRYGSYELGRIRFIKSAQKLGFSLDEVAQLLKLEDGTHCDEARTQASHKLQDVQAKLADLKRIEAALIDLIGQCSRVDGQVSCPLISALGNFN